MEKSSGTRENFGKASAKESKKSVKLSDKCEYIPYCDSPVQGIVKSVKMDETCDYIPYSPNSRNSPGIEQIQDTSNYIRSNERHQVTPVDLFSRIPPQNDEISPHNEEIKDEISSHNEESKDEIPLGIEEINDEISAHTEEIKDETLILGEAKCEWCEKIKREHEVALNDKSRECIEALNDKSRECIEALTELHDLKMELMRKSMHVGSLAFAVEGQVKEKTKWFQCLNGLTEKILVLKNEYKNLAHNAREYKENLHTDFSKLSHALTMAVDRCLNIEHDHEDLKRKFLEETKERKNLYNKLIEIKGNIRVFCRCRPMNTQEIEAGDTMALDFESAKEGELLVKGHISSKKVFKFDSVFTPDETQEQVFEKMAPFATSVLDGYNVCIFAYGQTGTGKTFTMEGTSEDRGMNYRTLEELFRIIKEREGLFRYEINVSVLEVYNEQIHDLLAQSNAPQPASKRLEVKQLSEGVHHVPGLMEAPVRDMSEAWNVLQSGSKARVVGSTNANEHSSRSHCMHCVMVRGENLITGEMTRSKLWLIDLAGSERVGKTDAQGERLKEAQNINKSLSALGDVISALATKSPHIPFRNSKLTHILQDSLSGDSKTLMFLQISPNENDVGETLCSLNFASRVRGIELGQAKKQVDVAELSRYKIMAGKAKLESKSKEAQIKCMEDTIQSLEMRNKSNIQANKSLQDKIRELESQLLVERKLARQHVDTKIAEDHNNMRENNPPHEVVQQEIIERFRPRLSMKPLTEINTKMLYDKLNQNILRQEITTGAGKAKRVSVCPTARRVEVNPSTKGRRSTLAVVPDRLPLPICSMLPSTSNNVSRSILRRSLQKRVLIRPALRQAGRRAAATGENNNKGVGGVEKKARRVQFSNGGVGTGQFAEQRGWNNRFGV